MNNFFKIMLLLCLFISCHKEQTKSNDKPTSSEKYTNEIQNDVKFIKGSEIFDYQCAACHRMDRKLVGPALKNITNIREKEWLFSFIANSQEKIENGDSLAVKIWLEYNKAPMPTFKHLSKGELENLYYFLEKYK